MAQHLPSGGLGAVIAQATPAVLALLGDGAPRAEAAIITALADRHPKNDIVLTLVRLAVTDQLIDKSGKYTLPAAETEQG
jgi:hypothetical protein